MERLKLITMTVEETKKFKNVTIGAGAAFLAAYLLLLVEKNEDPKITRTTFLVGGIILVFFSQANFKDSNLQS